MWIERRLEHRIRTTPFGELLLSVRTTVETRAARGGNARPEGLAAIVAGSERARLIRSAPDRCVPRSLALVLLCASRGLRAHAVIGVRTRPFAAHCWAQHGPIVLSDPLETVAPFTPILVI
ncbi:MAG: lasso peptide biosynthesis B2 protein [Agrobacterium tumefaciens]